MKKKVLDSWKRPIEIEVTEEKYPQQLQFTFGPREATPDEFNEWQEKELSWLGRKTISICSHSFFSTIKCIRIYGNYDDVNRSRI